MDLGLKGKVALVVAASKGLGFAAARQLVLEGANVAICSRSQERVDTAVQKLQEAGGEGTAVAGFVTDVMDTDQLYKLVADTVAHFGGLDILITNAGGPPGGTFESTDIAAWEKALNLTLMSVTHLVKAALPHLRQSNAASILTVTSFSVKQPVPGLLLSNVLRPGVVGLTKALSQELGSIGIRANSILPGWTATERVGEIMDYRAQQNGTTPDAEIAKVTSGIPLGRMGDPTEFGNVAAFLVSPAASYISGAMLQVDGGSYAGLL
ncbi:MAG: SDR family oxidoreductase [Ardenticatenaceae bacterium]|nr:SDR family oxidoreductase [Anaerolineales bacterium]MCB8920320.1 SDR family oxidoreductase [Ardenticatenaceae bacterium]